MIEEMIQVMQFLHVIDSHFDQWIAIKWTKMCKVANLPSLDHLLCRIKDEYCQKKECVALQVQATLYGLVPYNMQSTMQHDHNITMALIYCNHCGFL